MVDAVANLTTATASDRDSIAQLMATVARLTMGLATMNENIVIALQGKRASCGIRKGRDRAARGKGVGARDAAKTGSGAPILSETAGGTDLETHIH